MTENIDLDKPIPPEWRVRGADSHLHSIGLSLFKSQLHPNRRLLYHPLLVFIAMIIRLNICLLIIYNVMKGDKLDFLTHIYLGDLGYYISLSYSANVIIANLSFLTIGSQLINYYNYRNGIKPTDLRVFHMICGFISPKSIAINDQILVNKLSIITRKLFKTYKPLIVILIIFASIYIMTAILLWDNLFHAIIIGLPHLIMYIIWVLYIINIHGYQTIYYYIIALLVYYENFHE